MSTDAAAAEVDARPAITIDLTDDMAPPQTEEAGDAGTDTDAAAEGAHDDAGEDSTDEPDTFPREYVTELRQEAAEHRRRATAAEERAEQLAGALWAERVAALGLLADPADLPYDAEALDAPAEIRRLADELLTRRPHLRTRRITARAGQGEGNGADSVSLTGIMRAHA